jgi:hypothetical protein
MEFVFSLETEAAELVVKMALGSKKLRAQLM